MLQLEASAKESTEQLRKALQQRDDEVKALELKLKESGDVHTALKEQAGQLGSDLKLSESSCRDYKAEVERLRGVVDERDGKISDLDRRIGTLESEQGHQVVANEDLKRKLEELQGKLQSSADEAAELKAAAREKDGKMEALAEQLRGAEKITEAHKKQLQTSEVLVRGCMHLCWHRHRHRHWHRHRHIPRRRPSHMRRDRPMLMPGPAPVHAQAQTPAHTRQRHMHRHRHRHRHRHVLRRDAQAWAQKPTLRLRARPMH